MTESKSSRNLSEPNYQGLFKDHRLEIRTNSLSQDIFTKLTVIVNRLAKNRSEIVGIGRLLAHDKVSEEALIEEMVERCGKNVVRKHVLAIQDTTEINYALHQGKLSKDDPDLGPVGNNKDIGFFLHPMLVLDALDAFPLGVASVKIWNRKWDKETKVERNYKNQPIEDKESNKWIESAQKAKEVLRNAAMVTIISDSESDIYEEFINVPDQKTHLLVRAVQNRALRDSKMLLNEFLASQEKMGMYELEIRDDHKKRKPRKAKIEVRFTRVTIKRPSGAKAKVQASVTMWAVEARESSETAPGGDEEPILWRLLTTHEVTTCEQALTIILWYYWRWTIEQLFRTMKSEGINIEGTFIESGKKLKKLAILAVDGATRVMQLVKNRDGKEVRPVSIAFVQKQTELIKELMPEYEGKTEKQKNPFPENSLAWAAWLIARIGGWKGYQKARPAGPITMKRGLEIFERMYEGWRIGNRTVASKRRAKR